jgi:hypothetical protein
MLFQRLDNLERTQNLGVGAPGPPGEGAVPFPSSVTYSFVDATSQLGVATANAVISSCRFIADPVLTPAPDLLSKTLVLNNYVDGSHIVVINETPGNDTFYLTVSCTNTDLSRYSISMVSEAVSFRRELGTWSTYNGF